MNTRLKFFLINYLNQRRVSRHSGFALPLAVMIGLCIIVVGLSVVMQAQGNQSKVISQKAKASSMAATETGLTRIQSMMNDVKFVALYPMGSWASAMTLTNGNTSVTINNAGLDNMVNSVAKSTACSSTDATTKANEIKTKLKSKQLVIHQNYDKKTLVPRQDSNPPPPDAQSDTLTTELHKQHNKLTQK